MKRRRLGKTGLLVSEIGFGGEWLERHPEQEGIDLIHYASAQGINILDCWMADPKSRDIIGKGIKDNRSRWYIQGHIGSTWKDGQYFRTRDMRYVRPAFEDLLARLQTDYIDLGMIHYVDSEQEWEQIQHSDYLDYVMDLRRRGVIRHIGISSHNPMVAMKAAQSGYVEMILFSINPAFDMLPASEDIDTLFAEKYDSALSGIDPQPRKAVPSLRAGGRRHHRHEGLCRRAAVRREALAVRRGPDPRAVHPLRPDPPRRGRGHVRLRHERAGGSGRRL